MPHYGFEIAGEFRRGQHRGGGKVLHAYARDRGRAMQLHLQAYQLILQQTTTRSALEARWLSEQFAAAVMYGNAYHQAWRLQTLTDLSTLPDYEEGWDRDGRGVQGAPVDADGNPVFHQSPASWETAQTDGERWRWLLTQAANWNPPRKNLVKMIRARFLKSQFGVETLAEFGWWFGNRAAQDDSAETGTFALHTLGENETIARLATGIRRFELPAEHNPLKIYQDIYSGPDEIERYPAAEQLATTFENRRQYVRAAEYWQHFLQGAPNSHGKDRLHQILGNWGRLEPVVSQPAGEGATIDFRFRNGRRVEFTARRIEVRQLLEDVKSYLKKNPPKWEWATVRLENLGHRLIVQGQDKYLGDEVARWSLDLEPLEKHVDRRITVSTPLQEPGAYLLTSQMDDGNKTSVVVWLSDTAIVKKPLSGKSLYYVADAVSGQPIAGCNVEFFGYWRENREGGKYQIHTKDFAELTDKNGLVELSHADANRRHQWVALATTPTGRFAYLGFHQVWTGEYHDQQYKQLKVFAITDRPVYRPKQRVQYKFWVRLAQYDLEEKSQFASQSFRVEIRNPKNESVFSEQLTADSYGGLAGTWEVPDGAMLGQYRIDVVHHGGGTFRVEEYQKPEFEVTVDAPTEPVKLGDRFTATVSAKYYFGEPVTTATVKYKVLRTRYDPAWFPPMPWDWLYGPGYWWFAEDYQWYPGWARWGCRAPLPWWHWRAPTPPEIVAEQEVAIGPDGRVEIEIDSALAAQYHPDHDHSYQILAEVVDPSRRSIVGKGRVLVTRQPFRVTLWTERGYYHVGDTIHIGSSARTPTNKPVEGTGTPRLLKVRYEDAKPVETEVGRWELATSEEGQAELQIKASEAGMYRLSYEMVDQAGSSIEGGQIITVAGAGFDSAEFRYNDLELVP